MHNIPEIVGHTFLKAMTPINIKHEFMVVGLVPMNRDVFLDCDLMPAETRYCSKPVNNITPEIDNSVHDTETPSTSEYTINVYITRECETIQDG